MTPALSLSASVLCRGLVGVAMGVLLYAPSAGAQDAREPFTMRAVRAPAPPEIDGVIEDDEWRSASRGEDFIQFQPNRGEPSLLSTVVYVQYDDENLYVAFEAHDPEPLMGQMTERDAALWNDDSVQIYLDTFHDARSGYFFMTNVLGTQLDGRIAEDGTSSDDTWDAPWDSATRRTGYGYAVEVSIPFSSLQFTSGSNVTWGINFARSRRRTLERSYWSRASRSMGPHLPSRRFPRPGGQATDAAPPVHPLFAGADTATPDAERRGGPRFPVCADSPDLGLRNAEPRLRDDRSQPGGNQPHAVRALADREAPVLPGGQELFNQRIQTFYSRRIGDISVGAKTLGRQNGWTFALLSTWGDIGDDGAAYTIARVQRDVSSRSNVGMVFANRGHDGLQQGSIGLDANLFFSDTFGFTEQLITSYGQRDDGTLAYFARPSYDSSTAHVHVRYTHLADGFADNVNAVGFIRDDNRRELDGAIEKTIWVTGGAIERVEYTSNYNAYWAARVADAS